MKYEDLIKQQQLREDWSEHIENNIAMVILLDYLKKSSEHKLPYPNTGNFIEDIFQNYFKVKKTSNEKILIELMEEHKFKYSSSIHNAIYYLLGKKDELSELYIDPSLWPGVNEINNKNNKMVLNTILGTIEVFKASKLFEKDNKYIFQKN